MTKHLYDLKYIKIVGDILSLPQYQLMKECIHHGGNCLDHSVRVSYISYKVGKALHFDYKSLARAGLLHDFVILDKDIIKNNPKLYLYILNNHPNLALESSKDYFEINKKEENIISSHMFPLGNSFPIYKESWLLSLVDKIVAIYDKIYAINKKCLKKWQDMI